MADPIEREFRFLGEIGRYELFLRLYRSVDADDAARLSGLLGSGDPLVPLIVLQYLEEIPEKKALQAIIRLVKDGNEVVARAAMNAYRLNHYPGKSRLLKSLILSRSERACRFAVRTLSRAGFVDALPLILRELPGREGVVRAEMIEALRFIPDRRSVAVLLPLADSPDEETRFSALQVLEEIQIRERILPSRFFLQRAQDSSERVRRLALEVLQRLPTRGVARLFIEQALRRDESQATRERAIRALAAFPSIEWVAPLVRLMAEEEAAGLRLAVEIAMRAFPDKIRRAGLLPLLEEAAPAVRRQAAVLLAEAHGGEAPVRERLFALWRAAGDDEAVDLTEMLRELGGRDSTRLLIESMGRSPEMAYSAAGALNRLLGHENAPLILAMLRDPATPQLAKQALMGHWAKRAPEESVRAELLPWLQSALRDEVVNIRYLALQALAVYPLSEKLPDLLDLLGREDSPDVVRSIYRHILRGLGRDPRPLIEAWGGRPDKERLLGHAIKLLTSQGWDPGLAEDMLEGLSRPPLSLVSEGPEAFFAVCAHLMERCGVTLERVWRFLDRGALRRRFLLLLASFMHSPKRRFPPLPVDFLAFQLADAEPDLRRLYFSLLEADGNPACAEALVAGLLREKRPELLAAGAACLRRMVERPRA